MKNAKQAIVLFQSSSARNKICADLNRYESISYQYAESMTQLQDLLDQDQVPLIFAQAPQLPLPLTIANLRGLVGLGSVIVVTDSISPAQVSEILLAGADVVAENTVTHTGWSRCGG